MSYNPLTWQEVKEEDVDNDDEGEDEDEFLNPKLKDDMEEDTFQFTEILAH